MIEAMACGTPVVAFRRGSVPEVMVDGVTGFVVDNVDEAVVAVGRVAGLSRAGCRRVFEERFNSERMTRDYLEVYRRLVGARSEQSRPTPHASPAERSGRTARTWRAETAAPGQAPAARQGPRWSS
jgi:hypothetical protein